MLGLVDDTIGVTEAGYKAQQMNAYFNVKTAEKSLQFGPNKCKTMLIGKDTKNVLNSKLSVDNWKVEHEDNKETGDNDLVETYSGQIDIEATDQQKYLGFVISNKNNNMANINEVKKKSIGSIQQIFNRLNSLKLQRYYFECALIFMNVMLRPSILYACECYYNLKETEIRQIERIEEGFLRQLFKTTSGCPLTQMYLESGQYPARFAIMKSRLLFLKYILDENDESLINKFVKLQLQQPTRGDWLSTCIENITFLNVKADLDDIRRMKKNQFKSLINEKIRISAFKYLLDKRGSKGKEIKYTDIEMSEYLCPNDNSLTIEEKQNMFSVRNRMSNIPSNFYLKTSDNIEICCGEIEDMEHVYKCKKLNENGNIVPEYCQLYNGNLSTQIEIYRRFQKNYLKRMDIKNTEGN